MGRERKMGWIGSSNFDSTGMEHTHSQRESFFSYISFYITCSGSATTIPAGSSGRRFFILESEREKNEENDARTTNDRYRPRWSFFLSLPQQAFHLQSENVL